MREQLYGWTKAEALGQTTHIFQKTVLSQTQEAVDEALLSEGQWDGELIHMRRDGTMIVIASRQVLQRDERGQPIGILEINRDITERKRVEKEIQRLNQELDKRVRQRTAQLGAATRNWRPLLFRSRTTCAPVCAGIDG